MWPYSNYWGGFTGGGAWTPPIPVGGSTGVGSGGLGGAPWWVQAGEHIFEQAGGYGWLNQWLFGGTGGTTGGGYLAPSGGSNLPVPQTLDVGALLNPLLQSGGANRQRVLASYEENPDIIQRFLDWLEAAGMVASLLQQLATSSIFAWPRIVQDLILLFYHDEPAAAEQLPFVVSEANRTFPQTGPGIPGNLPAEFLPVAMPAQARVSYRAPRGMVTVNDPTNPGQKLWVRKSVAKAMGLYKERAKAPVTGLEWKAVKKASQIEKKLARMLKGGCNFKVTQKR